MSTLQELVRYCNEEEHLGALMLTGEGGCGKTHLIEHDLAQELSETHFIVRVSLLSVDNVEALNKAIRKEYLMVCTPFLGKMKQERERNRNIFSALNDILRSLTPIGGSIASAVGSVDLLDYVPLEPVVEDFHNKGAKKRVVLVFDDLNRSELNWSKFVGIINHYCEQKKFTTIVVGDTDAFKPTNEENILLYKTVKEKTLARTVRYTPEYETIIHNVLTQSTWPSQEYADFLNENEQRILNVFCGDPSNRGSLVKRYHHIRTLNCALREFYPLYEVLTEEKVSDIGKYLYSFIVCMLVSRNGIKKDGRPSFENSEEEIKLLYPDYDPALMPEEIRQWIKEGIWEKERIADAISGRQ